MGLLKKCPCFCVRGRGAVDDEINELDFSHCCLEEVPGTVFAHERTLETVRLDSNQIRELPRVSHHKIMNRLSINYPILFQGSISL